MGNDWDDYTLVDTGTQFARVRKARPSRLAAVSRLKCGFQEKPGAKLCKNPTPCQEHYPK